MNSCWVRVKSHLAILALLLLTSSNGCTIPAIFNFGDSNSDTGEASAAFYRIDYPLWFSYLNKPSGRICDGRLIIDYIAEKFGFPYLSPYLDSFASNFKHGVNFACGGSTIQNADARMYGEGYCPFSLDIQVLQFEQFRDRTFQLYKQGKRSWFLTNNLPKPDDFSKSLYALDIGQNDLDYGFKTMTEMHLVETIPNITSKFSTAVEKLYELGARIFWIHNTGPIGCLPHYIITYLQKPEKRDQIGCSKSHNEVAQEFNRQLKDKVYQLRKQFADAAFTYTDVYTAKYSLISEAKIHGFDDPFGYCCGHLGDYHVNCDKNAKNTPYLCSKPENFISWDGIHYTQSANEKVADTISDGSLSDPPISINEACHQISRNIVTEKTNCKVGIKWKNEACVIEQLKPLCRYLSDISEDVSSGIKASNVIALTDLQEERKE